MKRTSSSEQVGPNHRKDSGVDSKSNRTRTGSTGSNSSGKKATEKYVNEYIYIYLSSHVIDWIRATHTLTRYTSTFRWLSSPLTSCSKQREPVFSAGKSQVSCSRVIEYVSLNQDWIIRAMVILSLFFLTGLSRKYRHLLNTCPQNKWLATQMSFCLAAMQLN